MPRKHVNIEIDAQHFQVSVLSPVDHQSIKQTWLTTPRNPKLSSGTDWTNTEIPLNLCRALDQAVLACSLMSKKLAQESYKSIKYINANINRNEITYVLTLAFNNIGNEVILKYSWDENAQLIHPDNFGTLKTLGLTEEAICALEKDLTHISFGRLGLVARCLRLMGDNGKRRKINPLPGSPLSTSRLA